MKLIVEMDMPQQGCCDCMVELMGHCMIQDKDVPLRNENGDYPTELPKGCPIKGVLPDDHGDLVDYDEVEKEFNRLLTYMEEVPDENGIIWFRRETIIPCGYTMKFHTIIPAERKKNE